MSKPLRETMPTIAAFVDDLRAAFGAETINTQIKRGMAGEVGFFASENGQTAGTRFPARGNAITLDQMDIRKANPKTCDCPVCVASRRTSTSKKRP